MDDGFLLGSEVGIRPWLGAAGSARAILFSSREVLDVLPRSGSSHRAGPSHSHVGQSSSTCDNGSARALALIEVWRLQGGSTPRRESLRKQHSEESLVRAAVEACHPRSGEAALK